MDEGPLELAAYAILRDGTMLGFATVDRARAWREVNDGWKEFGWSDPHWRRWKADRLRSVEPAPDARGEG